MQKVGILTRYFNNFNYGGLLQSYALQKYIQNMGYDARQISFDYSENKRFTYYIKENAKNIIKRLLFNKYVVHLKLWKQGMKEFENMVPHTEKIFKNAEIKECIDDFDIFICGSDQIWNPDFSDLYYYGLGFIPSDKRKISYSASISKSKLTQIEKEKMYPYIKELDYISIREFQLQNEISNDINKDIEVTCDPTMLLKREQWDAVKKSNDLNNYVFAYLLGEDKRQRELIVKFAQSRKLRIVFIPCVYNYRFSYVIKNFDFGDIRLDNTDPAGFIGLIENAKYVITDSFHASVFSIIYHTNFYVVKRKDGDGKECMGSRLYTLLDKMLLRDRLLPDNDSLDEMLALGSISESKWKAVDKEMDIYREKSISFLEKGLHF